MVQVWHTKQGSGHSTAEGRIIIAMDQTQQKLKDVKDVGMRLGKRQSSGAFSCAFGRKGGRAGAAARDNLVGSSRMFHRTTSMTGIYHMAWLDPVDAAWTKNRKL